MILLRFYLNITSGLHYYNNINKQKHMEQTNIKDSYTAMSDGLDWEIRPDKHSYYPVLHCWMDGTLVYESGIYKDKNGKEVSLQHGKIEYSYDELRGLKDVTPEYKNVNELFKQIVKDFKISEADKPQLFRLLTDFSVEQLFKSKGSYEFIAFLHNYNFKLHF